MINHQLFDPKSIVVVGASNDPSKPGGKVLKNLIDGGFDGDLYVVNPKEDEVQGIKSYREMGDLPEVDLAIIAVAAALVPGIVKVLLEDKSTRALIVLSAGFSEESAEGAKLENEITDLANKHNATLIGPNCIGVLTPHYNGVFTLPIPRLEPHGCDFISGSGATACFIMESGIPRGLTFANVFSVGNSAQTGVEDILQHMDEHYEPGISPRVKLLYIEHIGDPQKLLKHASSLVRKGCKIAAVKSGVSEAGSRAATSHTGALASPDAAVDALFAKAGIVRCYGREDLIAVASVFMHPGLRGRNIAVITHAGGPAVTLTDSLSEQGLRVPAIEGQHAKELKSRLFPGSSVSNPIDFLATGTAEQLESVIGYVDEEIEFIDGMIVIFGSPGLFPIYDVYEVIDRKMKVCKKPIFPVLPSILTAEKEVSFFLSHGRIYFADEVVLGRALGRVFNTPPPPEPGRYKPDMKSNVIDKLLKDQGKGYLPPDKVARLLDAAEIPRVEERIVSNEKEAVDVAGKLGYPVAMKAVGPLHKSDSGGVVLNVRVSESVKEKFRELMQIPGTDAVMIQPMAAGNEIFIGVKYEPGYGHLVMCGLGGIFIEVLKDVSTALAPLTHKEAMRMIRSLKSYKILKGARGKKGINLDLYADIIVRVSHLVNNFPRIAEMDLNPLMAGKEYIFTVDARIALGK